MGARRILIADDSPAEADRIRESLASVRGTELHVVGDGATALSECKRSRFDLVLCDYEMPGLNGLQVVRLLRSTWSRLELPVLMLTVRDDVQTKVLSLRTGANDYVTKPVEPEELLARVQAQLDLKAAADATVAARMRLLEGRKLATIGRLAAGLAHDLNTPAQFTADNLVFLKKALASTGELLSRTRAGLAARPSEVATLADEFSSFWQERRLDYLLAESPKAVEEALSGISRMARTVRDLKEFAGLPGPSWAPADLHRAVENTLAVSRQLWSPLADVQLERDAGVPLLPCDVTALKQAFFDILAAAVERASRAARPGGEGPRPLMQIRIRFKRVEDAIEIQFADDGPALPVELEGAVAQPDMAAEWLLDEHGLGVAFSVVTVQHQGRLSIESLPGRGAAITVWLPDGLSNRGPRTLAPVAVGSGG